MSPKRLRHPPIVVDAVQSVLRPFFRVIRTLQAAVVDELGEEITPAETIDTRVDLIEVDHDTPQRLRARWSVVARRI